MFPLHGWRRVPPAALAEPRRLAPILRVPTRGASGRSGGVRGPRRGGAARVQQPALIPGSPRRKQHKFERARRRSAGRAAARREAGSGAAWGRRPVGRTRGGPRRSASAGAGPLVVARRRPSRRSAADLRRPRADHSRGLRVGAAGGPRRARRRAAAPAPPCARGRRLGGHGRGAAARAARLRRAARRRAGLGLCGAGLRLAAWPRGGNSKPWRPFSFRKSIAENGRPKRDVKSVSSSVRPFAQVGERLLARDLALADGARQHEAAGLRRGRLVAAARLGARRRARARPCAGRPLPGPSAGPRTRTASASRRRRAPRRAGSARAARGRPRTRAARSRPRRRSPRSAPPPSRSSRSISRWPW